MSRILIVDDDPQGLYMLESLLKGHGHQVVTAVNGAEALAKARREPPDAIVLRFSSCRRWMDSPSAENASGTSVLKDVPFYRLHRHLHRSEGRRTGPRPGGRSIPDQTPRA